MQSEEVLILVKAIPQPSRKHGETVCCAGVTLERKWRRLYPIRFRHLGENRFSRWQWVRYSWVLPKSDARHESRHVFEDKIEPRRIMPERERAEFLEPHIVGSAREAMSRGDSLALVRPQETKFRYREKPPQLIAQERKAYEAAARQGSLFDKELAALEPSPFIFQLNFLDEEGWHRPSCSDWETTATYWKHAKNYGPDRALDHLDNMYNDVYREKGMVLALGNMAKRPKTWLLLGVIRLDQPIGPRLFP